ncbi:hypothetical protein [Acinetobacter indicus]|uniref:hypothetical protein n=1 Tax=Acinetobacter indicus TaxID=756892 RepID=UPI001FA6B0E7|nr:hypothetical protein [Acinetobacter indicus]UNW04350.1 hypothetical protein MOW12_00275 [Acinetobacter indicus]
MKKILIISNNVLSSQNNNGKTLLSFFKDHPKSHLAQLYFSSEKLDGDYVSTSYRISDKDVLKAAFSYKKKAGAELSYVKSSGEILKKESSRVKVGNFKNSNLARLLRELVWKISSINHQSLSKWVADFNPDVIFFCAGDSLFAYDIYQTVCSYFPNIKKVVYITDDYILPRETLNLFWLLRRRLTYSKMKKAVVEADVFVTISEEMRIEYKKLFNKDSILAFNMSTDLKIDDFKKTARSDLLLVYAGGLHFKRWGTLAVLARALKRFNNENNRKVTLEIYSHQNVDSDILREIEIQGVSRFCGSLDERGVQYALNNADILVHAESFEKKCIESTRLSISTKIAEYISIGSKILAVGPSSLASMKFLASSAVCINDFNTIDFKVKELLDDGFCLKQDLDILKNKMLKNKNNFKLNVVS